MCYSLLAMYRRFRLSCCPHHLPQKSHTHLHSHSSELQIRVDWSLPSGVFQTPKIFRVLGSVVILSSVLNYDVFRLPAALFRPVTQVPHAFLYDMTVFPQQTQHRPKSDESLMVPVLLTFLELPNGAFQNKIVMLGK